MSQSFLERIRPEIFARVDALKRTMSPADWESRALERPVKSSFAAAISQPDRLNIIAEIKKASPSRGVIRKDFDPLVLAQTYERHGAAALSVLTEEKYFLGDIRFLEAVAAGTSLPVLRKDFIVDEVQIAQARMSGAAAVLLIVALPAPTALAGLMTACEKYSLDALVEVHDVEDLRIANDAGATIVGVNNRNLNTLEVEVNVSERLIAHKGAGQIFVAESGLNSNAQLRKLRALGFDGFLIGEQFMRASDPGAELDRVRGSA